MARRNRSQPMPVKHWSFAGLLLTYGCNARCANCYLCSAPQAGGDMNVDDAVAFWEGLVRASPHGCRIHIGGGEPFGRWEALIELARRARAARMGPLEAVETNAFWASDTRIVRDRLAALDDAGMGRLTISADPYHQQFVPIERVRVAARVGSEVLGPQRVRVRWWDWVAEGFDTGPLDPTRRRQVFAAWARKGRDRLTGRAAEELASFFALKPARAFADNPCADRLLRSRHVHVDGSGRVCGGTCAGIVLARLTDAASVVAAWRRLAEAFGRPGSRPEQDLEVAAILSARGPTGLLDRATVLGYDARPGGYADKCHLCWDVRRWLFEKGHFAGQLGPAGVYRPGPPGPACTA